MELDWPEHIRGFFQILNILSLSLSALSPRCVLSDWKYLNKVPITNSVPPAMYLILVAHLYCQPRVRYALQWLWAQPTLFSQSRQERATSLGSPNDTTEPQGGVWAVLESEKKLPILSKVRSAFQVFDWLQPVP